MKVLIKTSKAEIENELSLLYNQHFNHQMHLYSSNKHALMSSKCQTNTLYVFTIFYLEEEKMA